MCGAALIIHWVGHLLQYLEQLADFEWTLPKAVLCGLLFWFLKWGKKEIQKKMGSLRWLVIKARERKKTKSQVTEVCRLKARAILECPGHLEMMPSGHCSRVPEKSEEPGKGCRIYFYFRIFDFCFNMTRSPLWGGEKISVLIEKGELNYHTDIDNGYHFGAVSLFYGTVSFIRQKGTE